MCRMVLGFGDIDICIYTYMSSGLTKVIILHESIIHSPKACTYYNYHYQIPTSLSVEHLYCPAQSHGGVVQHKPFIVFDMDPQNAWRLEVKNPPILRSPRTPQQYGYQFSYCSALIRRPQNEKGKRVLLGYPKPYPKTLKP